MSSSQRQQFFFLGATGYIGSQFIESAKRDIELYAKLKTFTLVALVRDPDSDKAKRLQEVWPGVVLVKGTLDDAGVIEEQARDSALTFNAASSDHEVSIKGEIYPKLYRPRVNPSLCFVALSHRFWFAETIRRPSERTQASIHPYLGSGHPQRQQPRREDSCRKAY